MKNELKLNDVLATYDTIGKWGGREQEAMDKMNALLTAMYKAAPEDINKRLLMGKMFNAWETVWYSNLPDLTEKQIEDIVKRHFKC